MSHLWGGFSLKSGPRSHGNDLGHRATKHQITTFFLTCYQTFVHPLILVRLLRHRLATPCSQNPFDWSVATEKHSVPSFAHVDCMPAHQVATLKVIGRWLEDYPDDFLNHAQLSVSNAVRNVHPRNFCVNHKKNFYRHFVQNARKYLFFPPLSERGN